ncbi:MAG: HIT family protein [Rhodocyclaceae bacterium]|nr:HIT family protein [Rhodocyclaceae bacterium]
MEECLLCATPGGSLLWQDDFCRIVLVEGEEARAFPGYCRIVWQKHVAEFTDLTPTERLHLIRVVAAVESSLREILAPDKINLASLGNVVAHLHWHVIPRWRDDSHFPAPIWAAPQRPSPSRPPPPADVLASALAKHLDGSAAKAS